MASFSSLLFTGCLFIYIKASQSHVKVSFVEWYSGWDNSPVHLSLPSSWGILLLGSDWVRVPHWNSFECRFLSLPLPISASLECSRADFIDSHEYTWKLAHQFHMNKCSVMHKHAFAFPFCCHPCYHVHSFNMHMHN